MGGRILNVKFLSMPEQVQKNKDDIEKLGDNIDGLQEQINSIEVGGEGLPKILNIGWSKDEDDSRDTYFYVQLSKEFNPVTDRVYLYFRKRGGLTLEDGDTYTKRNQNQWKHPGNNRSGEPPHSINTNWGITFDDTRWTTVSEWGYPYINDGNKLQKIMLFDGEKLRDYLNYLFIDKRNRTGVMVGFRVVRLVNDGAPNPFVFGEMRAMHVWGTVLKEYGTQHFFTTFL